MFNVSENAVPTQYPLAMGYFGDTDEDLVARYSTRANDLASFGLITATEKQFLSNLIMRASVTMRADKEVAQGLLSQANEILSEKEKKALSKKGRTNPVSNLRFGPNDELITGVPNLYIYTGITLLLLSRFFKQKD